MHIPTDKLLKSAQLIHSEPFFRMLARLNIHDNSIIPLQVVLRSIVMESNISSNTSSAQAAVRNFDMGIKMGAVMLTSLPIMCVFPFLQKHFAKGVMVGAIKA